ncbi:MAG: ATP synthase subunit I [Oscillospiraceae bacterium]|nr:ATP synthase subunit I [Oscillospiraceae bacterium]
MDSRKIVYKETAIMALGEAICVALMLAVFYLLGYFDQKVLLGGIIGGIVTVANFFFMAIGTSLAADKAEGQDVKGGQALIKSSYLLRMVVMFVIIFACVKSGLCNVISLVVPLVFVRPVLTIGEFFRKKGENNT